jgi:hypothetical protein
MERFNSLINSLKNGFEEGRSATVLLNLLDEMRHELTQSIPASDHIQSPVSIWLPAGYQPPPEKIIPTVSAAKLTEFHSAQGEEFPVISNSIKDSLQVQTIREEEMEAVNVVVEPNLQFVNVGLATGVPIPPRIPVVEEAEEYQQDDLPDPSSYFPVEHDFLLPGNFHVHPGGIFPEAQPNYQLREQELPSESSIVVELTLGENPEMPESGLSPNPSMTITENFLKHNTSTQTEGRPLELHEILANRVVAQPSNGDLPRQGKVLADTFAGGKIQDIRKAIAINDRFRYIKSLFRGDESLFERSVKTINNFNILQEAQYWMQRELVIKLGWNEEDELVQHFYQLVARRFL